MPGGLQIYIIVPGREQDCCSPLKRGRGRRRQWQLDWLPCSPSSPIRSRGRARQGQDWGRSGGPQLTGAGFARSLRQPPDSSPAVRGPHPPSALSRVRRKSSERPSRKARHRERQRKSSIQPAATASASATSSAFSFSGTCSWRSGNSASPPVTSFSGQSASSRPAQSIALRAAEVTAAAMLNRKRALCLSRRRALIGSRSVWKPANHIARVGGWVELSFRLAETCQITC